MIYLVCTIMMATADGRHSTELHGYGDKFGSGYIVNLSQDAADSGASEPSQYRSYQDSFGDECHEE